MRTKMNPEVKQRWLAALRSGKYKKGRGTLRQTSRIPFLPDKFCALGVLCEIAVEDGVITKLKSNDGTRAYKYDNINTSSLPCQVITWARITALESCRLSSINDRSHAKNFDHEADWIEANL